jgi:wyosine [tRNA(Phe)-imidazoG37] synthetase (radical SAM superfamily)
MEVGGPYSALKVFHHRDRLEQLKRGEQIVPTQLQIILSDLCNHDCSFCSYRWSGYTSNELFTAGAELAAFGTNNPNRMLPYEKVIEVLDDCQEMGVQAIQYTGGGEPTVHPKHRELFQATIDRGLQFALVSNGAIFRKASADVRSTVDLLLEAAWVRFSIDAGNSNTYSAIRRIPKTIFRQVIDNIQSLVDAKAAAGRGPIIGIGFVVTKENWREAAQAAELAKTIGADNIRISAVFQPDDDAYFRDFHLNAAAACREATKFADASFAVFNRFSDRLEDLHDKHPDYSFCGYQQFNCYLGGDMSVYRCCNTAYSLHGLIGSIKDQRFKDLWASEVKRRKIGDFDASGCPRCMFNRVNKTINYALGEKAEHTAFV